jgi:hypothetical protein
MVQLHIWMGDGGLDYAHGRRHDIERFQGAKGGQTRDWTTWFVTWLYFKARLWEIFEMLSSMVSSRPQHLVSDKSHPTGRLPLGTQHMVLRRALAHRIRCGNIGNMLMMTSSNSREPTLKLAQPCQRLRCLSGRRMHPVFFP